MFQFPEIVRHYLRHEVICFLVRFLVVDQYFADIVGQVITECPDDRIAFPIDQEWGGSFDDDLLDRFPHGQQILQIPLEFFRAAVDARGSQDHAHARRHLDLL